VNCYVYQLTVLKITITNMVQRDNL